MKDLYEMFNEMDLREETDIQEMDSLEKARWKKRLRDQIRTGRKKHSGKRAAAAAAACVHLAPGMTATGTGQTILAMVQEAAQSHLPGVVHWVPGFSQTRDEYVTEIAKSFQVEDTTVTLADAVADEDTILFSFYLEQEKTDNSFGMQAELYAGEEKIGTGISNFMSWSEESQKARGKMRVLSEGADFSQIRDAELVLTCGYLNSSAEEKQEETIPITFTGKNLKEETKTQDVDYEYTISDGRKIQILQYSENQANLKLYAKVTYPEGYDRDNVNYITSLKGRTDMGDMVEFTRMQRYEQEDGTSTELFLADANIPAAAEFIKLYPYEWYISLEIGSVVEDILVQKEPLVIERQTD